ncbi:apoptosis-inducing factor, mitochondrion-associated, C-term-domain-containing protein [Spinellus fusiger]|nr:apoptosis-inducing factor, mitochondrion-associated, C-term-domain-containing protein [Spinellus fusiger]
MNLLRASTRVSRHLPTRALNARQAFPPRLKHAYSTAPSTATATATATATSQSHTPWFLGSLLVFGPLLFYLTSPPPKKKTVAPAVTIKATETHDEQHNVPVSTETPVEEAKSVPVQKPMVLIGGGTACYAAAKAIKERDPLANVILITEEPHLPYMRPPLSKELWFSDDSAVAETLVFKDWQGKERNTLYQSKESYEIIEDASGAEVPSEKIKVLRKRVVRLNVDSHTVTLEDGSDIYYSKVLLATGAAPKQLPGVKDPRVTTYRSLDDFKQLESKAKEGARIVVVGGGFLGSELAVALAHQAKKKQLKVTQIFPEGGNMANVFPSYLTRWTTSKVRELGVDVKNDATLQSIQSNEEGQLVVDLGSEQVFADHVVVAIGVEPRVELARQAGLEIDEARLGVVVNAELEARSDVFVAGDMVSFHDIQLGRRRIEHHDHAVLSGRHAGENMMGDAKPFTHQSMFWSDLGPKIGYEAVGLTDSRLSTVSVWAKATAQDTPAVGLALEAENPRTTLNTEVGTEQPSSVTISQLSKEDLYGKGLVFYVRDSKVVGLLLFNVFGKVQEARDIINAGYTSDKIDGLVKQFDIHSK